MHKHTIRLSEDVDAMKTKFIKCVLLFLISL